MTLSAAPEISVCIANYNGGEELLRCLSSVLTQEVDAGFEVIVHDDASQDGSVDKAAQYFPSIQLIRSGTNAGFCISNNRMVERARGRYLLLLNNDARLRPGALGAFLAAARDAGDNGILGLPQVGLATGEEIDRGYFVDPFLNPIACTAPGGHEVAVATGACLWIPRPAWDAVGGFPPWFESVAEDIFLCIAARQLGFPVRVLDAPAFDHWVGRSLGGGKVVRDSLQTTVRRRALSERNKTFAILCCYPLSWLALVLPLHAASLLAEVLFLALTGTPPQALRSIYGSLPGVLWRHRRQVMALRRRVRGGTCQSVAPFMRWWPHKLAMLIRFGAPRLD